MHDQLPSLKKTWVLHQKFHFPCKKQATEAILAAELWDKSWKEFCPFDL